VPGFLHEACDAFPGHIMVGLDAKGGKVAVDGWSKLTGHDVADLAKRFEDYGVEADDDVAGKGRAGVMEETGILHRGRADDDVSDAVVEAALDGVEIADAAAELDGNFLADFLQDGLDRRLVLGLAGEGAVEVDEMQPARALIDPVARHLGGVLGEDGGTIHHALLEADALAILEIDRGYQQHGENSSGIRDSSS